MNIPDFILALPQMDVPFDPEVVETRAIQSERGLMMMVMAHQDFELPMHHHKAQWGTVLEGELTLTIGDETRTYLRGDSYSIPDGAVHGGLLKAGTVVIDLFEEPDRYSIKSD